MPFQNSLLHLGAFTSQYTQLLACFLQREEHSILPSWADNWRFSTKDLKYELCRILGLVLTVHVCPMPL